MSIYVMAEVLESTVSPSRDRFLLLALADNADESGVCWPGVARLAGKTSLSRATVFRGLDALEQGGWIQREAQTRPNGSRTSSRYRINRRQLRASRRDWDADERAEVDMGPMDTTTQAEVSAGRGPSQRETGGKRVRETPPSQRETGVGSTGDGPRLSVRPPEPSLDPSLEPKDPPTPASGGDLADHDEQPPRPDRCVAHGRTACRPCGTSPRQVARAQQADEQTVAASERVRVQVQSREEHARRRQAAMGAGSGARQAIREHFARRDAG